MTSRSHRLSTKQFNEVISKGKVFHSPLFLMRALQTGEGPARIAAAVPVKIGKTAVIRNNLRRKVYEAVRPLLSDIKEGLHIILFAKTIYAPINHWSASTPALKSSANGSNPKSKSNKPLTGVLISNDLKGLFVKAGILR